MLRCRRRQLMSEREPPRGKAPASDTDQRRMASIGVTSTRLNIDPLSLCFGSPADRSGPVGFAPPPPDGFACSTSGSITTIDSSQACLEARGLSNRGSFVRLPRYHAGRSAQVHVASLLVPEPRRP